MFVASSMRRVDVLPVTGQLTCRNQASYDSMVTLVSRLLGFLWLTFSIKHEHSVGNNIYVCPSVFPGGIARIVGIPHLNQGCSSLSSVSM